MPNVRLVKHAARVQFEMAQAGNLFADTPQHLTFDELEAVAANRKWWKALQVGAEIDMAKGPPKTYDADADVSLDSPFVAPEDCPYVYDPYDFVCEGPTPEAANHIDDNRPPAKLPP